MTEFRRPSKGGWIVRARGGSLGLGKVVDEDRDSVTVEYFHSVRRQERVVHRRSDVLHVPLARQTRCYVCREEDSRWVMGRVGERYGTEYEINLPDRTSLYVAEASIYVRCAEPPDDPTDTLLVYGHETAHFYEARLRLVKSLVRERAAARGLAGLTSSRVELFPHQVEVARRVLQDPTQRYLLADEVGLGKTIEAGFIIRQFLLDDPRGRVLVVTPPLLADQWRHELDMKFDVFHGDRVVTVTTLELDDIPDRAEFGLLVVDEAHHLASDAWAADTVACMRFDKCRRLAHRTPRLLLLSATPAANHEAQFLAMLHLLDPAVYQLGDVEEFRAKVARRQDIGRVLLTLTETAQPFPLKLGLRRLAELFPEDEQLAAHIGRLASTLADSPGDARARAVAVRAIRTHVSETYRLHRRMLRNRRDALADAVLARSNFRVRVHREPNEAAMRTIDLFEEWRALAATAVRDDPVDSPARRGFLLAFLVLAHGLDGSPALLAAATACRLRIACPNDVALLVAEFGENTVAELSAAPLFAGEADLLRELCSATSEQTIAEERLRVVVNLLRNVRSGAGAAPPPKCIVFTGLRSSAQFLAERIAVALGRGVVVAHVAGLDRETVEERVHRFKTSRDCFVLVCDRSAEEGRNFQFVDHLIHYDLPWHPNRLEQRIGRADRISRRRDLVMHVLLGPESANAVDAAWYRLLAEGFGLFESSIASLQFYVDAHLPRVIETAFQQGARGLDLLVASTREAIRAERERIEEQAAIDEIDAREESAEEFFAELDERDAEHRKLQGAVEGWMCTVLNFGREIDTRTKGTVRYHAEGRTLVPADVLLTRFKPFLKRLGTYDRNIAARGAGVALHRLGEEVIDALAEYAAWDDRGQAFAIWREDPGWDPREGAEWIGFRFNLIVEADTNGAREILHRLAGKASSWKALDRRGDALLPPRTETVFIDSSLNEVTDGGLLTILRRPFSKIPGGAEGRARDHNLTKHRIDVIGAVVAAEVWERLCLSARDATLRLVRERPTFRDYCERCAVAAERQFDIRVAQLRLRAMRGGIAGDTDATLREMELEHALGNALVSGIRSPRVRVDSVGFVVVSGRAPLAPMADGSGAIEHA